MTINRRAKFILVSLTFIIPLLLTNIVNAYNTSKAPMNYKPQKAAKSDRQRKSEEGQPDVLLIQTAQPWDSDADTVVLNSLNYSHRVIDMTKVPETNIEDYQVILIVNDQVQSFYDSYADTYNKFEQYVKNGGVLVFFSCDNGWAEGDLISPLPGGVLSENQYECNNYIADSTHPIVTGELTDNNTPLTNEDTKNSYMSHGYFTNLEELVNTGEISRLKTIFIGSVSNKPTLIEYSLGSGSVIASMSTWEYAFYNTSGYEDKSECYRGAYAAKALDDVFKYAFSISGGNRSTGVNSSVYIDDAKNEGSYPLKARNDIIDFVGQITNIDPDNNSHLINLSFLFQSNLEVVKVFKRKDMSDYGDTRKDVVNNEHIQGDSKKITIENIEVEPGCKSFEYVVRAHIPDDFDYTTSYQNAYMVFTEVSGPTIETKTTEAKPFMVCKAANLIITNRRLLYENYSDEKKVNELLSYLYDMASDYPSSIVYYLDKYDESDTWTGKNPQGNPFSEWSDVREDSNSWYSKCFDGDSKSDQSEETCINKTTNQVDAYANYWIDNLGGATGNNKIYLVIIGGDEVVPHYRVWDPWERIKNSGNISRLSDVQKKCAQENYIFSDIIYYDTDNKGWGEGNGLENIYLGRIPGITANDVHNCIKNGIWKASRHKLTMKMLLLTRKEGEPAKTVWGDPVPSVYGNWLVVKEDKDPHDPPAYAKVDLIDKDLARKNNLFNVINNNDIDLMWTYHHGSPYGLSGSHDAGYPSLIKGNDWDSASIENLVDTRPVWIASACWAGIIDGGSSKDYFGAKTLQQPFSGLLGATSVTPASQKKSQQSIADKIISDKKTVGQAIKEAKSELGDGDWQASTRFSYVYYGIPWIKLENALIARKKLERKMDIQNQRKVIVRSQNQKTIRQNVEITSFQRDQLDDFEIISIDGYYQKEEDKLPVVPLKKMTINIPLNATLDDVNLSYGSSVMEGNFNLPIFKYLPPNEYSDIVIDYSEISDNYGQVPSKRYHYQVSQGEGYQVLNLTYCPILYDPDSNTAEIFQSITIAYTITTPNQGVLDDFSPEKLTYSVGDAMTTSTKISNINDSLVSYGVTVQIHSLADTLINTETGSITIEPGKTDTAIIYINAPNEDGIYKLSVVVSDGENQIGLLKKTISVVTGRILNFTAPELIIIGEYGKFTMEYQNLSGSETTAYIDIYIYDDTSTQVAKLPQILETIASDNSKIISTQWFPSKSLPTGSYYSHMIVSVGNAYFKQSSDSFTIKKPSLSLTVPDKFNEDAGIVADEGTVSIPQKLANNLTVYLLSMDQSEITLTEKVIISSGYTSTNFDIVVVNDSDNDGNQNVVIQASANGYESAQASINVNDNDKSPPQESDDGGCFINALLE